MTLPAFAAVADLNARVPGADYADDDPTALAALADASATIRAATRRAWTNSDGTELALPTGADGWKADVLVKVCCSIARRVLDNPDGLTAVALGAYSEQRANGTGDVYLTTGERRDLEAVTGKGGVWALSITRSDCELDDTREVIDCYTPEGEHNGTMPFTYEPLTPP